MIEDLDRISGIVVLCSAYKGEEAKYLNHLLDLWTDNSLFVAAILKAIDTFGDSANEYLSAEDLYNDYEICSDTEVSSNNTQHPDFHDNYPTSQQYAKELVFLMKHEADEGSSEEDDNRGDQDDENGGGGGCFIDSVINYYSQHICYEIGLLKDWIFHK